VSGYLFDFARTTVVGDEPTDDQTALIVALQDAVTAGVEALRRGVPLAHIARRCEKVPAASSMRSAMASRREP
jgi:Xaa-Pro aminopeptidase